MSNLNNEIFNAVHTRFIAAFKHHLKSNRKWLINTPDGRVGSCDEFSTKNLESFGIGPICAVVDSHDPSNYFVMVRFTGEVLDFLAKHSISEFFGMRFYGGGLSEEGFGNQYRTLADIDDIFLEKDFRFNSLNEFVARELLALLQVPNFINSKK